MSLMECARGWHENEGDDICTRCGIDLNPPIEPEVLEAEMVLPQQIRDLLDQTETMSAREIRRSLEIRENHIRLFQSDLLRLQGIAAEIQEEMRGILEKLQRDKRHAYALEMALARSEG